jgi:hypothetical protein
MYLYYAISRMPNPRMNGFRLSPAAKKMAFPVPSRGSASSSASNLQIIHIKVDGAGSALRVQPIRALFERGIVLWRFPVSPRPSPLKEPLASASFLELRTRLIYVHK